MLQTKPQPIYKWKYDLSGSVNFLVINEAQSAQHQKSASHNACLRLDANFNTGR